MYKTILIDGMNYAFKAFYAMPHLTSLRNIRTEVVFGFLKNMQYIYEQYRPKNLIICWDSRNNKRKQMCKTYKAKRQEYTTEILELYKQVGELKTWLNKIGIINIEKDGYESDDLMAILAQNSKLHRMLICTGDNDLHQCISDNVHVYDKKKIYTLDDIEKRYGFRKSHLIIIEKALAGCASDNVGGISGIGEKKAAAIIQRSKGDVNEVFRIVDGELKASQQFDEALALVYLPLKDFPINLPEQKQIDRKAVVDMMYYFNIKNLNATTFLQ